MTADFTQVLLHKDTKTQEHRTGTLTFKKPLLVRWESAAPTPELLVVTAKEIWNAFPDEEIVYKYPLTSVQDSRSIVQVMTGQARLDKDFVIEKESTEDGLVKLELYPKEPLPALVEAVLWIDPQTLLIKKMRIYDFYSNENEITFSQQRPGATIPTSTFTYAPEKGMKIEDYSKGLPANAPEKGRNPLLK